MKAVSPLSPIGFKPSEISALTNEEVVQQHAEEAAFQWLLRDAAVSAPNYKLKDVADLDERVEANIDGLRVAGDTGWEVCEEQLGYLEPGEVFTAGVLAFEGGQDRRMQKVLDIVTADAALPRALISSLGWISFETIETLIETFLTSEIPEYRLVGIGGYAVHRRDPGPALLNLLHDPVDIVRARALKAVGELGRIDLAQDLIDRSSDESENCQFYAAWSAARLGICTNHIVAVLGDFVVLVSKQAEQALGLVLRCMQGEQARKLYDKLKASPNHLRLAAIGAGVIGDPALIPDLIEMMRREDIARTAGEAFSMITGVDIEYEDLDQDEPKGFVSVPTEAPEDEDVDVDPDEDLPWPNALLIETYWQAHKEHFQPGKRYLRGNRITSETLQLALRQGNQHQRAAAATELAIRNTNSALFNIRAPGIRQIGMLKP
jgi:uncharacterized protein (TIGR02270 family)